MTLGAALENARTLREQYLTLSREFQQVLPGGTLHRHRRASDLQAMAAWVIRAEQNGCALIRQGRLRATNRTLDLLDRDSTIGPRWQKLPAGAWAATQKGPGATLRDSLIEEANLMLKEGATVWTSRYARGERVVEVRFEGSRTAPPEEGLVLAIIHDMTELASAEAQVAAMRERLLQKERASIAGELAVGVAHDLGNLVGALSARLMLLESQPETFSDSVAAMREIIEAQSTLVRQLKASGTRHREAPEPLDLLADVLKPATHMVESSLHPRDRKRSICIHIEDQLAEMPKVLAARDEVVNVVINILLNARDAMPNGGVVRLAGRCDGQDVY
ncbi:MAG TPA: hypothetical protein VGG33_07240, partial [Polyangia bacterium]